MSTVGQRLALPRSKNRLCRNGVDMGELLDHLTWLFMLPYRVEIELFPDHTSLRIFEDQGMVIGVAGVKSLSVEGPTLYSCIGIVRTRLEQKKAELLTPAVN